MLFAVKNEKLFIQNENEILQIEAWGSDALRVRATRNHGFSEQDGGLLPTDTLAEIILEDHKATIQNGRISACVEKKNGQLVFLKDGEPILKEYNNPYSSAVRMSARAYSPLGGNDFYLKARFSSNAGEKLYGMGQYQQSELELKGCILELAPKNAQVSIPFYISNKGYGFLWNNPSVGKVSFGKNYTEWVSECSSEIDYWITVGDDPKSLLKNYTDVVDKEGVFFIDDIRANAKGYEYLAMKKLKRAEKG